MGIYFRDILLTRISRGANNCGQHPLEKNSYFIMRFSPHFQLFYFNDRLEFCEFFEGKIKRINNADLFSQLPLLIFIKGANISGGHCIYRMDEIKSLSFHIMFYHLFRGVAKYTVILFHHLDDCDLYTPPRHGAWRGDRTRWRTTRTKQGTTSVSWTLVFKHCSFKTTDFKLLKRKQQRYVCAVSVSVWEGCAFLFFLPLYWLWTITYTHVYASESSSLQVSS